MIRILIVDDHAILRAGLKQILAASSDVNVSDEAADGHQALAKLAVSHYDVVLLDLSMPGLGGIDLIKRIRQDHRDVRILVLSMHKEDQFAIRALRAGAAGYLTKESAPELLVSAIHKIATGGRFITPELAEKLAHELDESAPKPLHEQLSDREYQVLRMLTAGKSVNEVARELSLSAKTVSTHKLRIMQKLRIDSNADLVRYCIDHRLFD